MTCFFDFYFHFSKNLDMKKLTQIEFLNQLHSRVFSGYIQRLKIWYTSLTAEIFLVFEILRFL